MNCPACGAPIALKPDTEGYKCDYCHTVFYPGEEDDGVEIGAQADPQASIDGGVKIDAQDSAGSSNPSPASSLACPVCSLPSGAGLGRQNSGALLQPVPRPADAHAGAAADT